MSLFFTLHIRIPSGHTIYIYIYLYLFIYHTDTDNCVVMVRGKGSVSWMEAAKGGLDGGLKGKGSKGKNK